MKQVMIVLALCLVTIVSLNLGSLAAPPDGVLEAAFSHSVDSSAAVADRVSTNTGKTVTLHKVEVGVPFGDYYVDPIVVWCD